MRAALAIQRALSEANAHNAGDRAPQFTARIGLHSGLVVVDATGEVFGDAPNVAARLESIAKPGGICLSVDAYRQVKGRLDVAVTDLGPTQLKNIAEPIRVYSLQVGAPTQPRPCGPKRRVASRRSHSGSPGWPFGRSRRLVSLRCEPRARRSRYGAAPVATNAPAPAEAAHLSIVVLPFANLSGDPARTISPMASPKTSQPISRASATAS